MRDFNERFWEKVALIPFHDCWEWIAAKDKDGYGFFKVMRPKRMKKAHRLSWEMHYGEIPKGLHVLHKCDNPGCVRPEHLFLGTNYENKMDCISKGRQWYKRGDQLPQAKLTEKEVKDIRNRHAEGGVSHSALGRKYGVSASAIGLIVHRINWKHI